MSVYVEKLAEFSAMLRSEGLAVGTPETAGARRILTGRGRGRRGTGKPGLLTMAFYRLTF